MLAAVVVMMATVTTMTVVGDQFLIFIIFTRNCRVYFQLIFRKGNDSVKNAFVHFHQRLVFDVIGRTSVRRSAQSKRLVILKENKQKTNKD